MPAKVTMILNEVLMLYPPVTGQFPHTTKQSRPREISLNRGSLYTNPPPPELWGEKTEEFKLERFSKGVSAASQESFCILSVQMRPEIVHPTQLPHVRI